MTENKNETSFFLQELHPFPVSMEYVTVKMERWHYYIDRGKLMFIEGIYSKEKLEGVARRARTATQVIRT